MKRFVHIMLVVFLLGISAYASSDISVNTNESNNLTITNASSFEKKNTDFGEAYYIPSSKIMRFNINDNILFENATFRNVDIAIEYLDLECNYFYLKYDAVENSEKSHNDYVELYNTNQKKRYVISLDDAYFGNRLSNGDFQIAVPSSIYGEGLYIYNVEVIKKDVYSSIRIDAKTNVGGNIFFDGDKKEFDVTFTNNFDENVKLNVTYAIKDKDTKDVYYTNTKEVLVNKNSSLDDKVLIHSVTKYNTYILEVTCFLPEKNVKTVKAFDFSLCKDGKISGGNQRLGIGAHFNWGRENKKGMEIIKDAGINLLREGYSWSEFEKTEGNYVQTDINTEFINNAYKNDAKLLVMAGYGNTLYCGDHYKNMPVDDTSRAAYANYIYEMLRINPDKIEVVEVWNEPNLEGYNYNGASAGDYVKMLKAVHDRIKGDFPDVKIAGPALASAFLEEGHIFMEELLSADIDGDNECDAYKYFDVITLHHYTTDYTKVINHVKDFRQILDSYNCGDKDIYVTEFGNSEIGGAYYIDTKEGTKTLRGEEKQASMISRFILIFMGATDTDRWYLYDFSNDGFVENYAENNFGLVESVEHIVPYAAKKSLLAVSNINNLISTCDKVEYSVPNYSYNFKFTDTKRGFDVHALFTNSSTNKVLSFEPVGEKVEFFDMYGNKLNFLDVDGIYELEVSDNPIYAKVYHTTDKKFDVSIDGDLVNVKGCLMESNIGDMIALKVFDKNENLIYIDQKKLDKNLEFDFEFSNPPYVYEYSVSVGSSSFDEIYGFDVDISDMFNATVKIHNNGSLINTKEKFVSNTSYDAEVKINDKNIESFNMAVAYYNKGTLKDADVINSFDMQKEDGTYKAVLNNKNCEFDIVKIYLLDSFITLSPLINTIIIE